MAEHIFVGHAEEMKTAQIPTKCLSLTLLEYVENLDINGRSKVLAHPNHSVNE
jgi:hypothetical protein